MVDGTVAFFRETLSSPLTLFLALDAVGLQMFALLGSPTPLLVGLRIDPPLPALEALA